MAKTNAGEVTREITKLTAVGQAPPAFAEEYAQGRGTSSDQTDNQVPLIYVLNQLSPQVDEANPGYVAGAKPGDIWLKSHAKIVKGSDGLIFQPCHFYKDFVEWNPRERGGGLVDRYPDRPGDCVDEAGVKVRPGQFGRVFRPSGNEVKETKYFSGFALVDDAWVPYVSVFTSTGLTVANQWNSAIRSKLSPTGKLYDAQIQAWRLRTAIHANPKGRWYLLAPSFEGFINDEVQVQRGITLYAAFEAGEKVAEDLDIGAEIPASQEQIPF